MSEAFFPLRKSLPHFQSLSLSLSVCLCICLFLCLSVTVQCAYFSLIHITKWIPEYVSPNRSTNQSRFLAKPDKEIELPHARTVAPRYIGRASNIIPPIMEMIFCPIFELFLTSYILSIAEPHQNIKKKFSPLRSITVGFDCTWFFLQRTQFIEIFGVMYRLK